MSIQTIPLSDEAALYIGKRPVRFVAQVDIAVERDLTTVRRTLRTIKLAYCDRTDEDFVADFVADLGMVSVTEVAATALDEYVEALNEARDRLDELDITWPTAPPRHAPTDPRST